MPITASYPSPRIDESIIEIERHVERDCLHEGQAPAMEHANPPARVNGPPGWPSEARRSRRDSPARRKRLSVSSRERRSCDEQRDARPARRSLRPLDTTSRASLIDRHDGGKAPIRASSLFGIPNCGPTPASLGAGPAAFQALLIGVGDRPACLPQSLPRLRRRRSNGRLHVRVGGRPDPSPARLVNRATCGRRCGGSATVSCGPSRMGVGPAPAATTRPGERHARPRRDRCNVARHRNMSAARAQYPDA